MSEPFKREERYVVFKIKDAEKALTPEERENLFILWSKIVEWRMDAGKGHLECVVVEADWPEYEPTWAAIEKRVMK